MNIRDVKKRNIINFDDFLDKVHDENYKPIKNQSSEINPLSGLSNIKRQKAFDYAGYADSVFAGQSKIDVPGGRIEIGKGKIDAISTGSAFSSSGVTFESQTRIKRLGDMIVEAQQISTEGTITRDEKTKGLGDPKNLTDVDLFPTLTKKLNQTRNYDPFPQIFKDFFKRNYFWSSGRFHYKDPKGEGGDWGPYSPKGSICWTMGYSWPAHPERGTRRVHLEFEPSMKKVWYVGEEWEDSTPGSIHGAASWSMDITMDQAGLNKIIEGLKTSPVSRSWGRYIIQYGVEVFQSKWDNSISSGF
jgi:hypothetical protein